MFLKIYSLITKITYIFSSLVLKCEYKINCNVIGYRYAKDSFEDSKVIVDIDRTQAFQCVLFSKFLVVCLYVCKIVDIVSAFLYPRLVVDFCNLTSRPSIKHIRSYKYKYIPKFSNRSIIFISCKTNPLENSEKIFTQNTSRISLRPNKIAFLRKMYAIYKNILTVQYITKMKHIFKREKLNFI